MSDYGKTFMQWEFPEFEVYERGTAWYFWTTLLGGVLLLSAIFTGNFLFALIILLVVILFFLYERRGSRMLTCMLTEEGIVIDDLLYPYREMKDFRIVYEPPDVKKLYVAFPNALRPRITIGLVGENPLPVRKILRKYVAEDDEHTEEPLLDVVTRLLKL